MEPITLITGAMAISDAVGLTSWIGSKLGGEVGEKTAQAISGIAQDVSGAKTPEEALSWIQKDTALALEVKNRIIEQEHELQLLAIQDVANARDMYKSTDHSMADKISDNIMKYNLVYVLVLVLLVVGINFVPAIAVGVVSMVSALLGGIITKLLDERSQVTGFFLGSSRSSKDKSDQINAKMK